MAHIVYVTKNEICIDHVGPVRSGLHWVPVEKRIAFKLTTFTFKTLKTEHPRYLSELMQFYVPPRSVRSPGKKLLVLPDIKLANGRPSFSHAAPTVWNSLPENIRGSETVVGFIKLLKTFLFPPQHSPFHDWFHWKFIVSVHNFQRCGES